MKLQYKTKKKNITSSIYIKISCLSVDVWMDVWMDVSGDVT